jgi:hypothetical protein
MYAALRRQGQAAMNGRRMAAVVLAALAAGVTVITLQLASDHRDARVVWAVFAPAVGWSFIGTGSTCGATGRSTASAC